MNGLWVEVIGKDVTAFLGSWHCKWPDSGEYVIQHGIVCKRLDDSLAFRS